MLAREARCAVQPGRGLAARGVQLIAIALQIVAPKCAVCWTTYAGLLDASWFAATRINPGWFTATLCVTAAMLVMNTVSVWRTRRYGIALLTVLGWGLVIGGGLVGMLAARILGVLVLGSALIVPRWPGWVERAKRSL